MPRRCASTWKALAAARHDLNAGGLTNTPIVASDSRFGQPSDAELAIAGEREADRVCRCHRDDMARPDELLHSLLDVLADDSTVIAITPRLRGWCRRLGKALEERRHA